MGFEMEQVKTNLGVDARLDSYEALIYIIRSVVNGISTADIVKVTAVNTADKTIDVIPVVAEADAEGERIEPSHIFNVKYIEWQYGINAIQAVPAVGDIGLLVVCKKDISNINGGLVDSYRRFNLADGVYFGGLCGFNQEPAQFIKFDENGITITSPTDVAVNAPTASITTTGDTTITAGGNATITGNAIAITGSTVAISGSAVSLGSGSTPKAVALDGDPVYSGTKLVGNVQASSTEVVAN